MNLCIQQKPAEKAGREASQSSVYSRSILWQSDAQHAGGDHVETAVVRSIQQYVAGHVSRTALLMRLLPLSFTSLFGALILAVSIFPTNFDWRVRVISALTSPRDNPQGCWLPSLGIVAAMLLVWPSAGYVAQRLRPLAPRLARSAGLAFVLSFGLMAIAVAAQLAQPVMGLNWLHEFLARAAAGSFILGMLCCDACALKDRLRLFGGQGSLPPALAWCWMSLSLLPIICLAGIDVLMLLAQPAGQVWAEDFRQSFRHTMLWQLAFWEWIGAGLAYVFLTLSVVLLPTSCAAMSTRSGRASKPDRGQRGLTGAWAVEDVINPITQEQTENERTRFLPATRDDHAAMCFPNQEKSGTMKAIRIQVVTTTALLSVAATGCSGIHASKSISPLDFILPGLMQDRPPSPVLTPDSTPVILLAQE